MKTKDFTSQRFVLDLFPDDKSYQYMGSVRLNTEK